MLRDYGHREGAKIQDLDDGEILRDNEVQVPIVLTRGLKKSRKKVPQRCEH